MMGQIDILAGFTTLMQLEFFFMLYCIWSIKINILLLYFVMFTLFIFGMTVRLIKAMQSDVHTK